MLTISTPKKLILFLALFLQCISSFSLPNNSQSHSNPLLFGDAKFINGSSSVVKLTDPDAQNHTPRYGLLIWPEPIKFVGPNPVSFSTDLTFVIPRGNAVRLAFVIVSSDFPSKFSRESPKGVSKESRFFEVEFHNLVAGIAEKRVGVSVKSLVSSKVSNLSQKSFVLNDGSKFHSWIDYDSSSKRLEVRLGKFGFAKPYDPLLACQVDLGGIWKEEEVLMGLSSASERSMQSAIVYSWNFRVRNVPKGLHSQPVNPGLFSNEHVPIRSVPKWLHSRPVNPQLFSNESGEKDNTESKKGSCVLRFLSGLVFVTGCGALAAFVMLSLWAFFTRNKEAVIPTKCLVHPGDVRYEKINVVVEDRKDDVKS